MEELFSPKDDECDGDEDNEKEQFVLQSSVYWVYLYFCCCFFLILNHGNLCNGNQAIANTEKQRRAPQAIRIMNPNFLNVNMRLSHIKVT